MAEQSLEQLEQEFHQIVSGIHPADVVTKGNAQKKWNSIAETVTQSGKTRRSYYADCGTDRRYRRESEPEGADRDVCG